MAYLQNNSAFIPNGLTRYLPHSNQCDETNCSLAKRFGDAESCAQCPIYYDQRPVRLADRTNCGGVYRNTYGTLAKRKRENVYYNLNFCIRRRQISACECLLSLASIAPPVQKLFRGNRGWFPPLPPSGGGGTRYY